MATLTPTPRLDPASRDFLSLIAELTPDDRLAAYRHGEFSPHQCALWASAYPEEPPTVNDELEWIALALADLD